MEAIAERGHHATHIRNIINPRTKTATALFSAELAKESNNNEIFNISHLLH